MSAWVEGALALFIFACIILIVAGLYHRLEIRHEKRPRGGNYKLPPWKDVTRPKH